MSVSRKYKRCPECSKQCYCGSSEHLENNHVAGRNHFPAIQLPFCRSDHAQFHRNCERAGIDFRKQTNPIIRCLQALEALLVGLWMVVQELKKHARAVLDLTSMKVLATYPVGEDPDVLAFDPGLKILYVSAESGHVTVFREQGKRLAIEGEIFMPYAHTVSVDPDTHLVPFPLQDIDGHPVLRIMETTVSK